MPHDRNLSERIKARIPPLRRPHLALEGHKQKEKQKRGTHRQTQRGEDRKVGYLPSANKNPLQTAELPFHEKGENQDSRSLET